jgi:hypothetical protein
MAKFQALGISTRYSFLDRTYGMAKPITASSLATPAERGGHRQAGLVSVSASPGDRAVSLSVAHLMGRGP